MSSASKSRHFDDFIEHLIGKIHKRAILWDKNHELHNNRRQVAKEWECLETFYGKPDTVLKSKWRNLKDTFHREAKKIKIPPIENRTKSIYEYYEGQWKYFKSLLFLWDEQRHAKDDSEDGFISIDVNAEMDNLKQLKCELTDSDFTDNENDIEYYEEGTSADADNIAIEIPTTYNENIADPIGPETTKRKRQYKNQDKETPAKIRVYDANDDVSVSGIDEDMHFAKSLVPFMRKLNPVRKLIVRNEIHSLLIRELLCSRCRSKGPQPDCRCNF